MAGYSAVAMMALAASVSGCSAPDSLMSSVALPASDTTATVAGAPGPANSMFAPSEAGAPSAQPSTLNVTPQQRGYLDALNADGVHPSTELLALSIGSYVCQARAAGQGPQAVWDYVHPLVSNDVHNVHLSSMAPTPSDIDATTASYIRVASERLC